MKVEQSVKNDKFQTSSVVLLSSAHGVHDTYSSFLPVLLPGLIEKFGLTNTSAGLLSVFLQMPSLINPIIGHIADHKNLRFFIILTPALTGAAMSLLSIAPSYAFLAFLLIIAGLSNAAIHAVATVLTGTLAGKQLGKGMSFWMVGGELGRTLGPLVIVSAIGYLTYEGLPWLMLGGILVSLFLYLQLKDVSTITKTNGNSASWIEVLKKMGPVMLPIFILLFSRAMMMATLTTFLPTFLTTEGASLWVAGASLSILEAAGVAGAFLAGSLSDRFGRRTILTISFLVSPLIMLLFLQTQGLVQIPFLMIMGFFAISAPPVLLAIVQENFLENRSFANGIFMAINFALMSLAVLLVGRISDLSSLRFTFYLSAAVVLLGAPFIRLLPKSRRIFQKEV
ncbi:MAG: MFS transporter [Chloroflexi bacterium HGW-Chloroflexi-8]|nr:MAG: MFS transporter [Chloroflexi bacterium HGW-Chloroflexi-8]